MITIAFMTYSFNFTLLAGILLGSIALMTQNVETQAPRAKGEGRRSSEYAKTVIALPSGFFVLSIVLLFFGVIYIFE